MRALGLDLGAKRIGVAVSDSDGTVASPYEVITRSGNVDRDHQQIADLVAEVGAELVVVGLPYSLDGTVGPAASAALDELAELGRRLAVPVEAFDERLTTVTADRSLREMGVKGTARREVVDKVAAAVMLQSWLERRRRTGGSA